MRKAGKVLAACAALVSFLIAPAAYAAQYAALEDEDDAAPTPLDRAYIEILGCPSCAEEPAAPAGSRPFEFYGPIHLVNQQPPNPIMLSPVPEPAVVLADRESFFRLKLDLSNHLIDQENDGVITDFDFESLRFELAYHRGIWGGEASLRYPIGYLGTGFLDGTIREFHRWIGQRSDIRRARQPYQFRFLIVTRDGVVANPQNGSWHFGNLVVGYKYPLWDYSDGEDALSVRAAIKVPSSATGDLLNAGGWDYQLGVLYQRQLAHRLRVYLNADYVFVGEGEWQNVGYQNTPVELLALEYAIDRRTTAVVQYRSHTNPLQLGSEIADRDSHELTYGLHHRTSKKCTWTFGMSEDAKGMTAPDVIFMTYLKWEL